MPRAKTAKKTVSKTTAKKTATVKKPVAQSKPVRILPDSVYQHRYIANTNQGGTVMLTDIKKIVEFDEGFQNVIKITPNEYQESAELRNALSRGDLVDISEQYISYLEAQKNVKFNVRSAIIESRTTKNNKRSGAPAGYIHLPNDLVELEGEHLVEDYPHAVLNDPSKVRMEGVNESVESLYQRQKEAARRDGPLPTTEELSDIDGTSDERFHKTSVKVKTREDNPSRNIVEVLDQDDKGSFIVDDSYVDNSLPSVDPRMLSQPKSYRRPVGPKDSPMRQGEYAIDATETIGGGEPISEARPLSVPEDVSGDISPLADEMLGI